MRDAGDSNGGFRRPSKPSVGASSTPGFPGFRAYSSGNSDCVLSRFEKFSMALSPDPCCPICGQSVPEHGSDAVPN